MERKTDIGAEIGRIAAGYPGRGPRESLQEVAELRARLPAHARPPTIAVVGTNGKTSTATYLARLLTGAGLRTGCYTSPHLSSWGERVAVDGVPCPEPELVETLKEVHELAGGVAVERGELRFFDVLTLAAELLFARQGAEVVVYEAGIGGRLDAVRLLRPRLALLTGVARDHAEILGGTLELILREKLLVAPAAGTVLSMPLSQPLRSVAASLAAEVGFELAWVDGPPWRVPPAAGELADPLRRSLALALAAGQRAGELFKLAPLAGAELSGADLEVPGRYERGRHDDVPYLLDSAHNEAAWGELAEEVERRPPGPAGRPLVALVALSPDKDRDALTRALARLSGLDSVVVTRHLELAAVEPDDLAATLREAGLEVTTEANPVGATAVSFERAAGIGAGVVVFGSTHLAGEVGRELRAAQR